MLNYGLHRICGLKAAGSRKLQFSDRQLQISRKDYECSEFQCASKFPQNGRFPAQNFVFLEEKEVPTKSNFPIG